MKERIYPWIVLWMWAVSLTAGAAPRPEPSVVLPKSGDALKALRRLTNGDWQLDLTMVPGRDYVIEASTNARHWTLLTNLVGREPRLRWTDLDSRSVPMRLYRVAPRGFHWLRRRADGEVEFLLGVESGPEYLIETSSNLREWEPWERFISRGPALRLQHRPPAGSDRLFYRARQTRGNWLELQADGRYVIHPAQAWGVAYRVERSSNLNDWSLALHFIGTNSLEVLNLPPSAAGQELYRVSAAPLNDVYDAFIILGQSNAVGLGELADREDSDPSVWMFGNDYQFKIAYEPVDDSAGQVDLVSLDPSIATNSAHGHSFALRAAKGLTAVRANRTLLIPSARGSTAIQDWLPGTNRYDRSTLFGSANYRRSIAAPGGLKAIWYYGHESNSHPPHDPAVYIRDWRRLISELRQDFGPLPVIYVQLALSTTDYMADALHAAAEKQRLMETGSGDANALASHFMVVAFDLPMGDGIHLNRAALNTLADRVALATREHIYGENINGTGPRLTALFHPGGDKSRIRVQFNRKINEAFNNYDNQFRVYDAGQEVSLRRVAREPDATSVLLTLTRPAHGLAEVSYGGRTVVNTNVSLSNVIKDADGLPAPMFRRRPVGAEPIDR